MPSSSGRLSGSFGAERDQLLVGRLERALRHEQAGEREARLDAVGIGGDRRAESRFGAVHVLASKVLLRQPVTMRQLVRLEPDDVLEQLLDCGNLPFVEQ